MDIFWLILLAFLFTLSYTLSMNYAPKFCQMKDLIKICICGKFHQYSICSCEIKEFQSFLCIDSASMKWPLFELFGPYSPILLKFWAEVVQ